MALQHRGEKTNKNEQFQGSFAIGAAALYKKPVSFALEPHLVKLGAFFREHGKTEHLKLLRGYYARHRRRRAQAALQGAPVWEVDFVLDWLFMLRLPPFQGFYGVLGKDQKCPCGGSSQFNSFGGCHFPGGSTWLCGECGRTWVTLEQDIGFATSFCEAGAPVQFVACVQGDPCDPQPW